jgi:MFS family permease
MSTTTQAEATPAEPLRVLAIIAIAQVLALTLWFSATAVAPALRAAWALSIGDVGALTLAVQLGFVMGALSLALFNIPDLVPSRTLFCCCALIGAAANGLIPLLDDGDFRLVVALRVLTGASLAGVYPSGLKVMAGWFQRSRGMALGVLVGALTVGSAAPHLIGGLGADWKVVLWSASGLATIAALLMLTVRDGPFETRGSKFQWKLVASVFRNPKYRLATAGYLGHMWELYAMWTWLATWLAAWSIHASSPMGWVPTLTFVVVASGALGCWAAGLWADRAGRAKVAGASMLVSGCCALASPALYWLPLWLALPVLLVWGVSIVADSAQFSAIVTEVVDDRLRGTALTLQTALGFLLTLVSIRLTSAIAGQWGWQWAFPVLAIGPALGALAMHRLRRSDCRAIASTGS